MEQVDDSAAAQAFVQKYAAQAGLGTAMTRIIVNKLGESDWRETWERVKKEVRKRFGGGKGKLPPKPPLLSPPSWATVLVAFYILWQLGD